LYQLLSYLNQLLDTDMTNKQQTNNPKGRPKGSPNKSTALAREAIAKFVDSNADKLQQWLDEIAMNEKLGPKVAFDCFMQVAEYHVPKLARTEHTSPQDEPVKVIHEHKFLD
jgi:hypothetical protein